MFSSVVEAQGGPRNQVLNRSRGKNLACSGERGDPRSNVDRDTLHVLLSNLYLAGMQAAADFNVQRSDSLGNRARTTYGASRPVEGGEKAVSQ